jgi:phosphatidylglycerol---prolipoprotein diacylglyceryl transferase
VLNGHVHDFDPIIASVLGIHVWWYGLSYALGFLNAHLFLRRNRDELALSLPSVYDLTLFIAVGTLVGGRSLVVFNNEWDFYREHPSLIPAIWNGGLATHGLITGGFAGVLLFCSVRRVPFRPILDALAIPAAVILACGRIGNFIDGQIVGSLTDVPWAVKFPEADGFRHPVVLYDGLKNFLLVPLLMLVRRYDVPPGRLGALFVFMYASLRIPIDLFREYPITLFGLPTGQTFNIVMTIVGAILLTRSWMRTPADEARPPACAVWPRSSGIGWRRVAFAVVLTLALTIPSDATRDVPAAYGKRHPGLTHSAMYPPIAAALHQ